MASTMTPIAGSDDATSFDAFRQGVNVTTMGQQLVGLLPRMSAGSRPKKMVGLRPKVSQELNLNEPFVDNFGNNYTSNNNVVLWTRMTPTEPTNLAPTDLEPLYEGVVTTAEIPLGYGSAIYFAATFDDATDKSAYVLSDPEGLLSFSLADPPWPPGNPVTDDTDLPFSVSMWANIDNFTSTQYLFGKECFGGEGEYWAGVDPTFRKVTFGVEDENNSSEQIASSFTSLTSGMWYHLGFTYDGRGGSDAAQGLSVYINGTKEVVTIGGAGTYSGMAPFPFSPLYIGGATGGDQEIDGKVAEFVVWDSQLAEEEMLAIYNATRVGRTEAYATGQRAYRPIGSNTLFDDSMVAPKTRTLSVENTGKPSGVPLTFCKNCGDGTTTIFTGQLRPVDGYNNNYLGIVPNTVGITVTGGTSVWPGDTIVDNGFGLLSSGGATAAIGTINYDTAKWTLQFHEAEIPSLDSSFKIDLEVRAAMSTSSVTDAGDRIIMVPNHEAERRDFGQPKVFKDEEPYEDFQKFNPVLYLQDDTSTMMYPLILANVSMRDPDQFDGVIEPFTIRSRASRLSPEMPFFAHDIRASILSDAGECSRLKAIPILQFTDQEQSAYDCYEDGIENFGARLMHLESEEKPVVVGPLYPGYLTQAEATINPFAESSDTEEFRADLHIIDTTYGGTAMEFIDPGGMAAALEMMSKYEYTRADGSLGFVTPHSNEDHLPRHHKSSGAGFTFNNNELGTDSLAFGGLLK